MQRQTQYNKIRERKYNERRRYIKTEILTEDLEENRREDSQKSIVRARSVHLEEENKYYLETEKRTCNVSRKRRVH